MIFCALLNGTIFGGKFERSDIVYHAMFTILNVLNAKNRGESPKTRRKVKYSPRWCPWASLAPDKQVLWPQSSSKKVVECFPTFFEKKRVSSPASGITTTTSARAIRKERMSVPQCSHEWRPALLKCETPRSFSELWVVFFDFTSITDVFFLYFGKKGTTYNCLVHHPRKTVTGGTAGTSRSCNWKIRLGNFIVRSANEFLRPFVGDDVNRPVQSLRFFTDETKKK